MISVFTGGIDFTNWFITLNGEAYDTLAQVSGAPTLNSGIFLTEVSDF